METIWKGCFVGKQEKENSVNHRGNMAIRMMLAFSNKKEEGCQILLAWRCIVPKRATSNQKGGSRTCLNRSG
ncbi:MAG: hypothetical protein APR55_03865 [Methanolinea sp. SDB]|nr:MAG: hypothetical protein APR55_03865 [Methanolinea sp. SDB]